VIRWIHKSHSPRESCTSAGLFDDIADLRRTKPLRDGNALNKAGRISLQGRYGMERVKLFQAASPAHARFIAACTKQLRSVRLPPVRDVRGAFVIAQWVDGKAMAARNIGSAIGRMLAALHDSTPGELPDPGFSYFEDFVAPRFARACVALGMAAQGDRIREAAGWGAPKHVLCHNDLTPTNVIMTGSDLVPIDNEFLCFGEPQFDVVNAVAGSPTDVQIATVESYLGRRAEARLETDRCRAFWAMRYAGTLFVRGEIGLASELIERFPDVKLPLDRLLSQCG
jgi:hypothetical protein